MQLKKRGLAAAVTAIAALAVLATAASATLTPNPYTFGSTDRISFISLSEFGLSRCDITDLAGSINEASGTISGSITSGTVGNCSGIIRSGTLLLPLRVSGRLNGGSSVTLNLSFSLLILNTLGGHCLYAGTLTGTFTGPTRSFILVNGALSLITRLASGTPILGICQNPTDLRLATTLGSGTIG